MARGLLWGGGMAVTSETFIRSQTSTRTYGAALKQVIALDRRIFSHDDTSKVCTEKLFRDANDSDNMVVLMRSKGEPIGYGFVKIITAEWQDRSVRVFQPLAGLLPEYVGSNMAMMIGIRTCFRVLKLCGSPTYMVAFVVNPGLYRGLSRILENLYPSPGYVPAAHSLEPDVLKAAIERWGVLPAVGYEQAEHFVTQDVEVSRRRPFTPRCCEDEFFLQANPDYQSGRYLGVCARMSWMSMALAVLKEVSMRRSRPPADFVPSAQPTLRRR